MFVPVDVDLKEHPRTKKLARSLGVCPREAQGYLLCLWQWAFKYCEDGCIDGWTETDIADGCDFSGDPVLFRTALIDAGWLDKSGKLHAWNSHAGKLFRSREKAAEKMRMFRARKKKEQGQSGVLPLRDGNVTEESESRVRVKLKREKTLWSSDDDRECFNSFWNSYPKKVQKQKAIQAWKKLTPNGELQQTILSDVNTKANSEEWTKEDRQFCPHPASYLNGRRWEDEAPPPRDPTGFLKYAKPGVEEEDEPGYNPEFRAPRKDGRP